MDADKNERGNKDEHIPSPSLTTETITCGPEDEQIGNTGDMETKNDNWTSKLDRLAEAVEFLTSSVLKIKKIVEETRNDVMGMMDEQPSATRA